MTQIAQENDVMTTIKVFVDPSATLPVSNLTKLIIDLKEVSVAKALRRSITSAQITSVAGGPTRLQPSWESSRPILKFTGLALNYNTGITRQAYTLTFLIKDSSLNDICGGACQYATYSSSNNSGRPAPTCAVGSLGFRPIFSGDGGGGGWVVGGPTH